MTASTLTTPPPRATATALSGAVPFRATGSEAGLPERIKLLNWGENLGRTTGAKIIVDEAAAKLIPRYHAALALDKVLLDYEHQSYPPHPNYLPDPRPVPGHGQIEVVPGEGVFLSGLQYTPNGQANASNYADVSAVAHMDADGRLLYVSSVALTQCGDVAGMLFADHVAALSARINDPEAGSNPPKKPTTMDEPNYRELLIGLLGLEPDETGEISNESIVAALAAKNNKPAEEVAVSAEALSAKPAEYAAITQRLDERDRQDILREAAHTGKVIPLSNETIKTLTPAALREMVDKLTPGEVALSAVNSTKEKPAAKTVALNANQAAAAKALGLTDEQYLKGQG